MCKNDTANKGRTGHNEHDYSAAFGEQRGKNSCYRHSNNLDTADWQSQQRSRKATEPHVLYNKRQKGSVNVQDIRSTVPQCEYNTLRISKRFFGLRPLELSILDASAVRA